MRTGGSDQLSWAYKPSPVRRMILISVAMAVYAVILMLCYSTAGLPREAARDALFDRRAHSYGERWQSWVKDENAAMDPDSPLSLHGMRAREDALHRRESKLSADFWRFSVRYALIASCCVLTVCRRRLAFFACSSHYLTLHTLFENASLVQVYRRTSGRRCIPRVPSICV